MSISKYRVSLISSENMFPSMLHDKQYKCRHCRGTFAEKQHLNNHLLTHTGLKPHSCSKCSKEFTQKGALNVHMKRVHQRIKSHNCALCTSAFSSRIELKHHLGTHDKPKSYPCPLCPAAFVQKVTLTQHIDSVHSGVKKYKCTVCDDRFATAGTLRFHLKSKHSDGKEIYNCIICSKRYNQKSSLKMHLNSHSRQRIFKCILCSKEFLKKAYLKFHYAAKHTKSKPFKCHICSSSFIVKGKLTEHIKQTHGKKIRYKCTLCEKTFSYKCNLKSHIRSHTGGKMHKCPHCPLVADCKKDLARHLKLHNGNGKYKCTECSASFNGRSNLRHHLRSVHKKEPEPLVPLLYTCPQCPRQYKIKASFDRHFLTHSQIKAVKCDKCVARFHSKGHMIRHRIVHQNGTGEFVCTICNADFYQHGLLSHHTRKWHGLDTSYKSQNIFKCQYCIAKFKDRYQMIEHQKVHNKTTSNRYFCHKCRATFSSKSAISAHKNRWHGKSSLSSGPTASTIVGCAIGKTTGPLVHGKDRCPGLKPLNDQYERAPEKDTMSTNTDNILIDPKSFFANAFIE